MTDTPPSYQHFQYKCRRCDRVVDGPCSVDRIVNDFLNQLVVFGKVIMHNPCDGFAPGLRMFTTHACDDGGIGICDLIGSRKETNT